MSYYAVGVLTVAYVLSFIDRTILALLVAPIRADLGISDTQLSLLHGLAFAIFYTTLGIPIALLADRLNRRNIIAAGIAVWSLATAVCGLTRSFAQLFLARVAVGVGEAALSPAAYSMIADLFPRERLGRALGIYNVGAFAGAGLAFLIGGAVIAAVAQAGAVHLPVLGEVRSWQLVFFIVGLPGLLVALWVLTLAEPARRVEASTDGLSSRLAACLGHMRQHWQAYATHLVGFTLIGLVFNATLAWMPTHLIRNHGLATADAAFGVGMALLVMGSAGVMAGGLLTDRLDSRGPGDGALKVGLLSACLSLPLATACTLMPNATLTLGLYAGLVFATTLPFGAAAAAIQVITPTGMRATASAIYLFLLNLVGLGAGPTLVAMTTDFLFADDLAVGRSVALVGTLAALPAIGLFLWGLPHYRKIANAGQGSKRGE
ncbi:MAG: spinster family MFS transporter [Steroidobacteraceae bacterium]|jgi:MFS family permease